MNYLKGKCHNIGPFTFWYYKEPNKKVAHGWGIYYWNNEPIGKDLYILLGMREIEIFLG
jgi:hypothetical protein